jgi:dTDP-4-dehydrorhamnose 3,5-epimerase
MEVDSFPIRGMARIIPPLFKDGRGYFEPLYSEKSFSELGLHSRFNRLSRSYSALRGTLRGMHYQRPPFQEAKLVRVLRGAIWDVCLDLRRSEPTYGGHQGIEITRENRVMVLLPEGCAHGFVTLTDDVEIEYLCSADYSPCHERSIRWNEPRFAIEWPLEPVCLSEKDSNAPLFDEALHGLDAI